jgi:hypothetical protein
MPNLIAPTSYPTFNAWWGENLDRFPTFGMAHDEYERLHGEGARMRMFQAHLKSLAAPAPAPTIHTLAVELAGYFEERKRDNGTTYICLRNDRPEWAVTVIHEAHAGLLPDDWRYGFAKAATDFFADDAVHGDCDPRAVFEIAEEAIESTVSTTNAALAAWLASHATARCTFCDDAAQDLGLDAHTDMTGRLSEGQRAEITEVFELVRSALAHRVAELARTQRRVPELAL